MVSRGDYARARQLKALPPARNTVLFADLSHEMNLSVCSYPESARRFRYVHVGLCADRDSWHRNGGIEGPGVSALKTCAWCRVTNRATKIVIDGEFCLAGHSIQALFLGGRR